MSAPNPFGAAFDGRDRRSWPLPGARRGYHADPGVAASATEVIAGVLVVLATGALALGVFLPPPTDDEWPRGNTFAINPDWCLGAGWMGLAVALGLAVAVALVARSRTAWTVAAFGCVVAVATVAGSVGKVLLG